MIGEIDLMPSFRSKFEANAWKVLIKHFPNSKYEPNKLSFLQPAKVRTYVPDFKYTPLEEGLKELIEWEDQQYGKKIFTNAVGID